MSTRVGIVGGMLLMFASSAVAGEKDAFAKLAPNTWTPLGGVAYKFPKEYTGKFNMRFWCNLAWDPDGKRILFYEGYVGSHGHKYSIYANAMYSLEPAEKTVRLVNLSTHWKSGGGHYRYQATKAPPSPYPRHTWGAFIYVPKYKRVYIGTGAAGAENGKKADTFWSYDVAKNAWTDVTGKKPGPTGYQTHFAHFAGSDTLWVFTNRGGSWMNLYAFDMKKQAWAEKQIGRTNGFGASHVAIDAKRKLALVRASFRKPFASAFAIFDPAKKSLTPLKHPPEISTSSRMAYIPKHDKFFIHDPGGRKKKGEDGGKGKDWVYDPADSKFTQVKASNGDTLRMDNYLTYDALNDIVVIYTIKNQFKVFRYVPEKSPAKDEK